MSLKEDNVSPPPPQEEVQCTKGQELHGDVLWVCNFLSFLGSPADPWSALLGLCHLETVQGGSEQGGGKVALG